MKCATLLLVLIWVAGCHRTQVPARPAEILAAEIGTWRSTGWIHDGTHGRQVEAAWRCLPAGVANECKWRLMSRDSLLGADRHPEGLGEFMRNLAPRGPGLLRGRWEFVVEGERGVGVNEVRIVSPREWKQQTSIEIGNRRVLEISMTHRRVK